MGKYDDENKGGLFPTRTGPAIGASKERGMLDNIGGSDSFRTKIWNQPDGCTTRLKTKDGMPEFITECSGAEVKPCTDFLIKQEVLGDALPTVKAMLRTNPNERYGKQLGAALFTDSISATPEVDVATTNVNGLKNFSLPAAEGDTYLVRFPWSTKDVLLFGRDRHYCPYPKSSVKVGYLRWPFGTLRDGTKHIFILEVRITWSCATHYFYSPSYTMVEVFDAEHPDVVLKTLTFEGVYGQHATLNATPDTIHSVLTMTGIWPTMNNWNADDNPDDPIDPQGQLIIEFEATYDGALHVDSAILFDWGAEGTTNQISATSAHIGVPAAYMAPYVVTPTTPLGEAGVFYPILAGYGYDGERKIIYCTQRYEYDPGAGDYLEKGEVFANEALVCFIELRTPSGTLTASPASMLANSADYISSIGAAHYLGDHVHAVAVTNNVVTFGAWREAEKHFGNPVPHYGEGDFYCAISIEGDVFELGREELRIFPGNEKMFWYVNTYSDWAKDTNNRNREKYIADPIRAGISWNPISKEFSLENTVDSTYYDPTNLEGRFIGGIFTLVPATALVGTGFVGTRKKL